MFWRRSVRYNFPFRVVRIWPLFLSAIALGIFVYISPLFYKYALYKFVGVRAVGWYSDFGPYYYSSDRPYFLYAYKVGSATYGGRGLYDDAQSDIYYENLGHPVGVSYLTNKPWVSTLEPVEWDFEIGCIGVVLLAAVFVCGIRLSVTSRSRDSAG
jgi:hypothetical protein